MHSLHNTNLQTLPENLVLRNPQIKAFVLQSAQQTNKIDLDYYVVNHQRFNHHDLYYIVKFAQQKFTDLAQKNTPW